MSAADKEDYREQQQIAEPTVRLCVLRTWPKHFDGYGFNLHAEKSKQSTGSCGGQYVGKVDIGSPAESAGLREGDRIVQVDGVDIEGKSHSTVVALIKKERSADEAAADDPDDPFVSRSSLLVVDRRADVYYKEKGIRVHSEMGLQVLVLRTPEEPTAECLSLQQQNAKITASTNTTTVAAPVVNNDNSEPKNDATAMIGPTAATTVSSTATTNSAPAATLNLNMTAAELRRRLAESRKQDARRTGCTGDFRQKHELVDKL